MHVRTSYLWSYCEDACLHFCCIKIVFNWLWMQTTWNNKWWWQIFSHLLSASVSNAWLLHQILMASRTASRPDSAAGDQLESNKLDSLAFTRSIASSLLLLSNTDKQMPGRPPSSSKVVLVRNVPDSVRKNKDVVHHPVNMKQGRCKACKKNTTLGCGVCRLNLHTIDCFKIFHEAVHQDNS